jgi:hypothetical protein
MCWVAGTIWEGGLALFFLLLCRKPHSSSSSVSPQQVLLLRDVGRFAVLRCACAAEAAWDVKRRMKKKECF